jgi:hypothetical protein
VGSVSVRPRVATLPPIHRFPLPSRRHPRPPALLVAEPHHIHELDLKALLHVRSRVPPLRCRDGETHALLGLFLPRRLHRVLPPGVPPASR